jgi:polysaccharide pyruvyl transferase WcaK-like protein
LNGIVAEKCGDCAHDYVGIPGGKEQWQLLADSLLAKCGFSLIGLQRSFLYPLAVRGRRALRAAAFSRARSRLAGPRQSVKAAPSQLQRSVLICGWYGTETLGDKAILGAVLDAVRTVEPQSPIVICSLQPMLTRITTQEMAHSNDCTVIGVDEALRSVASARALVFAGGPLMAVNEIAIMESLFVRARDGEVPALVSGCGIGPLGSRPYRRSIAGLLSAASMRIYRDRESLDIAAGLGIDVRDDQVAEDPAFSWLQRLDCAGTPKRDVETRVLALGLRDWPHNQYAAHLTSAAAGRIKGRLEEAIVYALEKLIDEFPRLRILPVPFCTHDAGGDDRLLYWRLARQAVRVRYAFDMSVLQRGFAPQTYARLIARADAMLAMRFHSIVFSLALGLPTVALDYTLGRGKSSALGREHGLALTQVDQVDPHRLREALREALAAPVSRHRHSIQPAFPAAFRLAWDKCVG